MLWKELLWRLVTGISTSEFLLNSGIFFSALSIGRKWTNYQEPSDLLKKNSSFDFIVRRPTLLGSKEREWADLFGCAKNIVYLCPYKYTRDVWEDWIIGHSHCILPSYFNAILSLSNLSCYSACFCRDKNKSPPVARSLLPRQTVALCGDVGLYTVSLYDMICVNSVDNKLRVINLFLISIRTLPRPCSSGWNITQAWHVICTGICYCKLTYL